MIEIERLEPQRVSEENAEEEGCQSEREETSSDASASEDEDCNVKDSKEPTSAYRPKNETAEEKKCEEFIANTTEGAVSGYALKSRNGRNFIGFSGIPYAKPPLGELRFNDPKDPEQWNGIREAKIYGSPCVQLMYLIPLVRSAVIGDEDCLYLSVYTPKIKPEKLYPVLVYLHGGGFAFGFGEIGHGPSFFLDNDVVVVTFNYRLGSLGFLSMEDEILPGNLGLKDQNMALRWVQRNIANFGGDRNRVTIMGESSGGASVYFHMISPMSRGLFHAGISHSGTAFSPWATTVPGVARQRAIASAEILGCPSDNSTAMVKCLRDLDAYDIIKVHKNFDVWHNDPLIVFPPTSDPNSINPFLPQSVYESEPVSVPWLLGCNEFDGVLKTSTFDLYKNSYEELERNFTQLLPKILIYADTAKKPDEITKKLRQFYLNNKPFSKSEFKTITTMITDSWFIWPMVKALKKFQGPRYVYYNTYVGKESIQIVFSLFRHVINGTAHGDETLYLWNHETAFEPFQGNDLNFSKLLVKLWVNFATYGTPTPDRFKFKWPTWNNSENIYLKFTNDGISIENKFLVKRMNFWMNLGERDKFE